MLAEELYKILLGKLAEEFQTAEYVKDHGGIDLVVGVGTKFNYWYLLRVPLKKPRLSLKPTTNVVSIDKNLQSAS